MLCRRLCFAFYVVGGECRYDNRRLGRHNREHARGKARRCSNHATSPCVGCALLTVSSGRLCNKCKGGQEQHVSRPARELAEAAWPTIDRPGLHQARHAVREATARDRMV